MFCSSLVLSGFPEITTEMLKPKQNTQNKDEQASLPSQIKQIADLSSKLLRILSEQETNVNMKYIGGMCIFLINQRLSSAFPANPNTQPSFSTTNTTVESMPAVIPEVNFKPLEFFLGNPDHCGLLLQSKFFPKSSSIICL